MRRHEQRNAALAQLEEQIPEFAPCDWIDPRRRLVEKNDLRFVEQRAGQRQPLFPTAGEGRGELVEVLLQAAEVDQRRDPPFAVRSLELVGAPVEFEILSYREIFIQGERLRHVTDGAAHLIAFTLDVEAGDRSTARGRLGEPAEHLDRRRLAAPVRTEESVYFPARDLQREIVHRDSRAEAFGEVASLDRGFVQGRATSTVVPP